jgi:hypothetical protein
VRSSITVLSQSVKELRKPAVTRPQLVEARIEQISRKSS